MKKSNSKVKDLPKLNKEQELALESISYRSIVMGVLGWIAAFLYGAVSSGPSDYVATSIFVFIVFGCLGVSIFSGIKGLKSRNKKTKAKSACGIAISVFYVIFFLTSIIGIVGK